MSWMMSGLGMLGGGGGAGATAGSAVPGLGTVIGAGIGAGAGAISDAEARKARKKQEEAGRPRYRRMAAIQDALNQYREAKVASQLTLAQSAFNWADSLRL